MDAPDILAPSGYAQNPKESFPLMPKRGTEGGLVTPSRFAPRRPPPLDGLSAR